MRFNPTWLGFTLIGVAALAAIAYSSIEQQADTTKGLATPAAAERPAAAKPAETVQRAADAPDAYTHYRVGNAAARTVYADGAIMWVGTTMGLVRYDTGSGEHRYYDKRDGLPSDAILYAGKYGGRLMLGTHGGLSVFAPQDGSWQHYGVAEGLPDARVFGALAASNGDLWIATWAGATRVRGGLLGQRAEWRHHTVASTSGGLAGDRIYAVAEDRAGAIWFATQGGVSRYHRGKWTNWKGATGPAAADAMSVVVTADGTVWVGTLGAGLGAFDGKGWRAYTAADGLPSDRVLALHADEAGGLWIGTDKGLARFVKDKFSVLGPDEGLLGNSVYSIATPPDGTLWVGGNGGVAHIRKLAWRAAR